MSPIPCCGCHLESDYGTGQATGDGTTEAPFTVTQIDPTFKRPVVRVSRSLSQSIPNLTNTAVIFDTEEFDTNGMWTPGAPSRLTVPLAGIYLMGTSLVWNAAAAIPRSVFFRQDGATELHRKSAINNSAEAHYMCHNYMYYFEVGAYIEVVCFQQSGSSLGINKNDATICAWMMYLGKKV